MQITNLKRLRPLLTLVALAAVTTIAVATADAPATGTSFAQGSAPPTPPPPPTLPPAMSPAQGIEIQWREVVGHDHPLAYVYWDIDPGTAGYGWVAHVDLTQWLGTATTGARWADAIEWTRARELLTEINCRGNYPWCGRNHVAVSGLTPNREYVFTVVQSADGVSGHVWPDPVWLPASQGEWSAAPPPVAPATPTPSPITPGGDVCSSPFAAVLPQCGAETPPTPTPQPTFDWSGYCDRIPDSPLPQCQ